MPTTDRNYVQPVISDLTQLLPGCDGILLNLYAVLALTRGVNTRLEDVHDAWSVWQNLSDPQHRSLIPFGQLSPEVQELDRKYMDAIHYAAAAQHARRQLRPTASRPYSFEADTNQRSTLTSVDHTTTVEPTVEPGYATEDAPNSARWYCSCGARSKSDYLFPPTAEKQAADHSSGGES